MPALRTGRGLDWTSMTEQERERPIDGSLHEGGA